MKLPLEHFIEEAELRCQHLSAEERQALAERCHREHPGFAEAEQMGAIPAPPVDLLATPRFSAAVAEWLWRICILLLLLFIAMTARAEDLKPVPVTPPGTTKIENPSAEERSQIQALQIQAYQIITRIKEAELAKFKADADKAAAEAELDVKNVDIRKFVAHLAVKYKAQEMDLTPEYTWIKPVKK